MTVDEQLRALASVRLTWAPTPDDVWEAQQPLHVPGLHDTALTAVLDAFTDARNSDVTNPLGVVVQGQAGAGKTHLLGFIRERVQQQGGYFFLLKLLDASSFWRSTLFGMLEDLGRPSPEHDTQLRALLWRLANLAGISRVQRKAIVGDSPVDRTTLDTFVTRLYAVDPPLMQKYRRTLRALVLYAAGLELREIGESYLLCSDETNPGERTKWGIGPVVATHQEIARDLSRLLAATGPAVLAIDQIDTLITQMGHSGTDGSGRPSGAAAFDDVAHGLMSLRETLSRTVPVLSCLPSAWEVIDRSATVTVRDRFRVCALSQLPTPDVARELIQRRLERAYTTVGFVPPYPTWPIADPAFTDAHDYTPRRLLQLVDRHIRLCLERGSVEEMTTLTARTEDRAHSAAATIRHSGDLTVLDARFAQLRSAATTDDVSEPAAEDLVVPGLLAAGLDAWIRETGAPGDVYQQEVPPGTKPALHALLRRTLDEETETHVQWAFRAITSPNPVASMNRLQKACIASGFNSGVAGRHVIVLRNGPWPAGAKTQAAVAEFTRAGGRTISFSPDDVRTFAALRTMLDDRPENLDDWLRSRRPAHGTGLLGLVLDGEIPADPPEYEIDSAAEPITPPGITATEDAEPDRVPVTTEVTSATPTIPLGTAVDTGERVCVDLEALRKHTAIFAGSGSGKTVLIRRIIEECALQGVSSIILDPNNDLSRLGSPWPDGERSWTPEDRAKADDYLEHTEVVVWTPRRQNGRPLAFHPLPDFASVVDDADEFDAAVESAVAALAPRAKVDGKSASADKARAVLKQALEYFGEHAHGSLDQFVALLEDLPEDISNLRNATKIAADLAENLKASMANDPLFGGQGAAADPGTLLTPSPGRRARVSVVNLSGLPSDDQRQGFVNQLQMALFAWIKKNPAGDRPLGALFVMDEAQNFAPSGGFTACTQSTLALASQARKYGLGLVFATQAPKGLNNKIPGNAATQFYGLLNSGAQIQAAQEMARVKGGTVPDIGRLSAGHFYAAIEGAEFRKTRTPLCLTHHPKSPPTEEEVLELAASGA